MRIYRGILNTSWQTPPKVNPVPPDGAAYVAKPVLSPASEFVYHPDDSEPLPVGKSAVREGWRERGYDE